MKNKIKFIALSFLSFAALTSCDEDQVIYDGASFVSFNRVESTRVSTSENVGTFQLPVYISAPQDHDVVVNFTVTPATGTTVGTHYNIVGNSVTIPAGQTSGNIEIQVMDNTVEDPIRSLQIKLESLSDSGVMLGISDVGSTVKTVLIINDDCPTKFLYWIGDITVEDVGVGFTPGTAEATAFGECDVLVVNNNLPGESAPTAANAYFNKKYELHFTPDDASGQTGTVTVNPTIIKAYSNPQYNYVYSATGTYSTVTGKIVLDYTVDFYTAVGGDFVQNAYGGRNIIKLAN